MVVKVACHISTFSLKTSNVSAIRNKQFSLQKISISYDGESEKCMLGDRDKDMVNARGLIRGILGGGVPLRPPSPDPISDQKISFSTPVFRPDL